ncbi:MAG: FAD:protein FMN transferase [Thermoleophilia bacterium]
MSTGTPLTPGGMRRLGFAAMGTRVEVLLPAEHVDDGHVVRALFQDWEARLSRFRPDSELSRLNARGGGVVSPLLAGVLDAALRAARRTDGLFDPGLCAQLCAAGYDRPFNEMDPASEPSSVLPLPGGAWRRVQLTDRGFVRLPQGMRLDFGGIAKGMAVDCAAHELRRRGVPGGMISAGGDLTVWGEPPAGDAWIVAIDTDPPVPHVPLRHGSLATSTTGRRRWGATAHHTIDPRTGRPAATDLLQVSVAADTCGMAETVATAALVAGTAGAMDLLERLDLPALLIPLRGDPVTVGAWPAATPLGASR